MQLQARKQRQLSARTTRKQRYQQSGGAPFINIPADRMSKWQPYLEKLGIKSLLTDRTSAPADDATKKQRMDDYITIMMKQDDLFQAAIKLEMDNANIKDATLKGLIASAGTVKDPPGDKGLNYILDVENAVAFTFTNLADTKWKKLRSEPLMNLFFYPWRGSNVFIRTLADYFRELAKDTDDIIGTINIDELKALLASHIEATVRSNAWYLTDRDLEDGFFTTQPISAFKKSVTGFFPKLVEKLKDNVTISVDKLFSNCTSVFVSDEKALDGNIELYATITSLLFFLYRAKKDTWSTVELVKALGAKCTGTLTQTALTGALKSDRIKYLPNEDYWKVPISINNVDTGVTFETLFTTYHPIFLNYLLRFSYALENPDAGMPLTGSASSAPKK